MTHRFLPYGRQTIENDDIESVISVLRSDYLTTGPAVGEFERAFATETGAKHAAACSSGTAALHLAAMALGLGSGDLVIVPSLTFLSTANAARYVGAEVVFADTDPDTGLLTAETLERAFAAAESRASGHVKAVIPVHLNGQTCDMQSIGEFSREHGLNLIEDACHALGGDGVGACAESAMAAFSLHPVKVIASGEGGVVTTNDDVMAERLNRFRNHGMVREPERFNCTDQAFDSGDTVNPWYYEMPEIGFNYRLSDINAALACSQLRKLGRFVKERADLVALYDTLLEPLRPCVQPVAQREGASAAWHLFVVLIDFKTLGISRAQLMNQLRAQGIGTQVHYLPVHRQPYYRERYGELNLDGADTYYARALSLPLFPSMSKADVERVVAALSEVLDGA